MLSVVTVWWLMLYVVTVWWLMLFVVTVLGFICNHDEMLTNPTAPWWKFFDRRSHPAGTAVSIACFLFPLIVLLRIT